MNHVLSIDLESWVHFYDDVFGEKNIRTSAERKDLDNGYIVRAVDYLLSVLEKYHGKATFFVVGEIFDWYPEEILKIKNAKHEIGYHAHEHQILKNGSILLEQLMKSKDFISTFKPKGFRAPQIYLTEDSMGILKDWGFEYSSSTYGDYSKRGEVEGIYEIPVSSLQYFSSVLEPPSFPRCLNFGLLLKELPFGSGLFLAVLRGRLSNILNTMEKKGKPAILFVHPWQVFEAGSIHNLNFRLKIICKNPLALPYTLLVKNQFEDLLSSHQFTSFEGLRNGH